MIVFCKGYLITFYQATVNWIYGITVAFLEDAMMYNDEQWDYKGIQFQKEKKQEI